MKILGWTLVDGQSSVDRGYRSGWLASSAKKCATAGVKNRVVDETPLEKEEHSYFRTQVGRSLFLSVLLSDLQYAVGQLARHASAPTAPDRIALKRLIRFLWTTRDTTLEFFPKGRLVLSAVADADWAGLAERRSVTRCGAVGGMLCGKLVADSSIVCAE